MDNYNPMNPEVKSTDDANYRVNPMDELKFETFHVHEADSKPKDQSSR